MTSMQTVMESREQRANRTNYEFEVNPEDLKSDQCTIEGHFDRANHVFFNTCPTTFDPICNDPLYNKFEEFEFRCRFPLRTNTPLVMNSSSFLELIRVRDPYAREWCMIVLFYSPSCPFSERLAPHFNAIAGKFENILPIAVDSSDFTKTHRLNFRYGISGTPTVLLWISGNGVARMGNKHLDEESIKSLITTHTDLVEMKGAEKKENNIPEKLFEVGAELKDLSFEVEENQLMSTLYTFACFLVCIATFIYHVRERILLSAPVLRWFQSKCGGPLCEDIYFLFYVAAPRNRGGPPYPPPPPADDELPPPPPPVDDNAIEVDLNGLMWEDQEQVDRRERMDQESDDDEESPPPVVNIPADD